MQAGDTFPRHRLTEQAEKDRSRKLCFSSASEGRHCDDNSTIRLYEFTALLSRRSLWLSTAAGVMVVRAFQKDQN